MSNESENRIDLTQFEGMTRDEWLQNGWHIGPNLIAELKKLYEFMDLHQICGCGAICPNMNKETWARVKICGFCESPK